MNSLPKSTCATCGYEWKTGLNGSHSCIEYLITRFNQRLIDRTTGFMQTLGQQSLEIAALKQERDAARAEVIKLEAQIEEMNRTWGDA